jgi:hypothetical protein
MANLYTPSPYKPFRQVFEIESVRRASDEDRRALRTYVDYGIRDCDPCFVAVYVTLTYNSHPRAIMPIPAVRFELPFPKQPEIGTQYVLTLAPEGS